MLRATVLLRGGAAMVKPLGALPKGALGHALI
jgi:hypothetical protein